MPQRIYGTAWSNEKELNGYLHQLEEAERRDHRRLGREMGLFHFQDEALGSIFWHPGLDAVEFPSSTCVSAWKKQVM